MEIWKDIEGYNGLYQVSNKGRVKSLQRVVQRRNGRSIPIKEKIIAFHLHKHGYHQVRLWNVKSKLCTIHRLVANAFLPNPNNYPVVMHLDNNPANNFVSNLSWGNQSINMLHCVKSGRYRNQHSPIPS